MRSVNSNLVNAPEALEVVLRQENDQRSAFGQDRGNLLDALEFGVHRVLPDAASVEEALLVLGVEALKGE